MNKNIKFLYTIFIVILVFAFVFTNVYAKQPDQPPEGNDPKPKPNPELVISPKSATVKSGETQQFGYSVKNGDAPTNVSWSASMGTISSGGLFTAGDKSGDGSVTVSATVNGIQLSTSAQVKVIEKEKPKPNPELDISPKSVTVKSGDTQQFGYSVKNGDAPTNVSWSASMGTISSGGLFTAGDKSGDGSVTVSATVNGVQLSASAQVKVLEKEKPKPNPELDISPKSVTVKSGDTQQFSYSVKNGDAPTNVSWSADIGTITSGGFFTAGDKSGSGSVTVSAKVNGIQLSASAKVKVLEKGQPKPNPELVITPAEVTLQVKVSQLFVLSVKDDDSVVPTDVKWKVTGNVGDITSGGLFTAGDKAGRGAVVATAEVDGVKLTATALVKVGEGENPGNNKKIVVTVKPDSVTLNSGDTQQFSIDPKGDSVEWRVIPDRIGSISNNGLFTASQNKGKGMVIATVTSGDAKGTGKAIVVISEDKTKPQQKLDLKVKPQYTKVDLGKSTDFEADLKGIDKTTQYSLEWKVDPNNLGTIQGTGTKITFVTNNKEGKALITATLTVGKEKLTDWAVADIVGEEKPKNEKFKVSLSPDSASFQVGDSQVFTANIIGASVEPTVTWSWSIAPKKLGTITVLNNKTASFTALEPGWGMLLAKADSGKSLGVGQAKIYISGKGGNNLKLAIIPESTTTEVGGKIIDYKLIDLNGSPLTGDVQWGAVPDKLGTLIGTGLTATFTTGNKAGHVLITAKLGDGKGHESAHARITITDHNPGGKLIATIIGPQSPQLGILANYKVSVSDSNGNLIDLSGAKIEWRVVPQKMGTINATGENATFNPVLAGRGVIIAEVETSKGKTTGRLSMTIDKK